MLFNITQMMCEPLLSLTFTERSLTVPWLVLEFTLRLALSTVVLKNAKVTT